MKNKSKDQYSINENGHFVIENYNNSKTFSNFFPGISGIWGIPMWVFYVNRGQCVTSFGIESKDKAIMEFQPANKAYRQTSLQGFRTFIKVKKAKKEFYYEPFQNDITGTDYKKEQKLTISAHDLTLEEINSDLGLKVVVKYFTLPQEPYAALVRKVSVENLDKTPKSVELVDGLPVINPYGTKDWLSKNMSRTLEAWMKVRNLNNKAPYYQLNVEVDDRPEVTHIEEGNFFFSFNPDAKGKKLLTPIVEASKVFGEHLDFIAPGAFIKNGIDFKDQQTSNRTPAAFGYLQGELKSQGQLQLVSMYGYASSVDMLNDVVKKAVNKKFVSDKEKQNEQIITEVKNNAATLSSSDEFDAYCGHTFLDNILRGGLPVSLKSSKGNVAFNVYSRKHGDLERDYNFFFVSPTYFSQGNGNYRDVNQNRRNDIWFNTDVGDNHLINFLNLSQLDGYNPLIVKATSFIAEDPKTLTTVLNKSVAKSDVETMTKYLSNYYLPGELLAFVEKNNIKLKVSIYDFLGMVIEVSRREVQADHGEGYWSDHWTYNLDLIESYLALYPEKLKGLLLEKKEFMFYQNNHYVLPRSKRYILTERGVRQYESVAVDEKMNAQGVLVREKHGEGGVFRTNLINKLLCLIANKVATLDPSGIGVEMEADKPNWYDALNGLPGLLGSAISETLEIKRFSQFLLDAIQSLKMEDTASVDVYDELATFISGLSNLLSVETKGKDYWFKSNDIKEHYRQIVRFGVDGKHKKMTLQSIKQFLNMVVAKVDRSVELAANKEGFLPTYFYHDVTEYKRLDKAQKEKHPFVEPLSFKRHDLPLFLEGYVHALRVETDDKNSKALYDQVRKSDLFDKKLKMYKVNANLSSESEEIGRARIFPSGWLENESVWLHMEYKYMLEVIRAGLYDEFYKDLKTVLVPFLSADTYGRSILENSSFIVSSAHEDKSLHGQGFVARLSGSTAEFLHIWLLMNVGQNPFQFSGNNELILKFDPALAGWLFTNKKSKFSYVHKVKGQVTVDIPANCYAFVFLNTTLVVYHNATKKNTYGKNSATIKNMELSYLHKKKTVKIPSSVVPSPYAGDIRDQKVDRIDVYFE